MILKPANILFLFVAFITIGMSGNVAAQTHSSAYPDSMQLNTEYTFELTNKLDEKQTITVKPIGNDSLQFTVTTSDADPILSFIPPTLVYSGTARLSLLMSYSKTFPNTYEWQYSFCDGAFTITIFGPDADHIRIQPTVTFDDGNMKRKK